MMNQNYQVTLPVPFRSVIQNREGILQLKNPNAFRQIHVAKRVTLSDIYAFVEDQHATLWIEALNELEQQERESMKGSIGQGVIATGGDAANQSQSPAAVIEGGTGGGDGGNDDRQQGQEAPEKKVAELETLS